MSFLTRLLLLVLLINICFAHVYWFEMPSPVKFSDGSDIPNNDEMLPMQKRFRVKYVRELAKLPNHGNW